MAAAVPAPLHLALVFAAGALTLVVLAALLRSGLRAALEPAGHRLDRWRRTWFYPERELAQLLAALLILAFLAAFAEHYALPGWATAALFAVWALRLPADGWSWVRTRRRGTLELHQRGFRLLDLGPLWLRALLALLAAALYLLIPPLRAALEAVMALLLTNFDRWLS